MDSIGRDAIQARNPASESLWSAMNKRACRDNATGLLSYLGISRSLKGRSPDRDLRKEEKDEGGREGSEGMQFFSLLSR